MDWTLNTKMQEAKNNFVYVVFLHTVSLEVRYFWWVNLLLFICQPALRAMSGIRFMFVTGNFRIWFRCVLWKEITWHFNYTQINTSQITVRFLTAMSWTRTNAGDLQQRGWTLMQSLLLYFFIYLLCIIELFEHTWVHNSACNWSSSLSVQLALVWES